jgi:CubicO group peptidase (beta-lactamase class C family)
VLQLVEAKKIDLDAPLKRYLPDYPNAELAEQVTIRHLLSHTGGTGDYFGPDFAKVSGALKTHADYVRIFGNRTPAFEPGSKSVYSNLGFVLLGAVIEKVSGEDYFSYVQHHIFDRAAMTGASFPIEGNGPAAMSSNYTGPAGQRVKRTLSIYRGVASGGGMASAEDMVRFGEALLDGRLVSKKMLAHIVAGDMKVGDKSYAYGLDRKTDDKGRVMLSHGGDGTGISAAFRIYPAEKSIAVAIANIDRPAAGDAMKEIAAAVE